MNKTTTHFNTSGIFSFCRVEGKKTNSIITSSPSSSPLVEGKEGSRWTFGRRSSKKGAWGHLRSSWHNENTVINKSHERGKPLKIMNGLLSFNQKHSHDLQIKKPASVKNVMIIFAFIIIWMSECTESCIVARKLTCVSPYCLLQEIALVEMFQPCDQIPGPPAFEIHPHHPLHLLKSILWRVQIWKFPFPFNSSHLNLPAKVNILLTFMSSR